MQKVFIGENNRVTIVCPRCGKSKDIDVTPYLTARKTAQITLRLKCSACDCGHKSCQDCIEYNCTNGNVFAIQLERRKFYRKKVLLTGTLFDIEDRKHPVKILDLSRTGLKMSIHGIKNITPGQKLKASFILDDAKESKVYKEFIVRKAAEKTITGEFIDTQSFDHYDKMIGFYLMKPTAGSPPQDS
jgi:hypothetical protein